MSAPVDELLTRSLAAAQRVEHLAEQLSALAIAVRDQSTVLRSDNAALRERMKRLETLIDASMLFSLRDRQAQRNEPKDPGEED